MKLQLFALFLALLLLGGCASTGRAAENLGRQTGKAESAREAAPEDALHIPAAANSAPAAGADSVPAAAPTAPSGEITAEQARSIALTHAGLTAEQAKYLRTEYEIDDGLPQYEVNFHYDRWEYDYEIDARTGNILSFERDD